jgi:lipopolysaccharide/colanic/teichoic acid biosynthesis glycosyltransferase
MLVALSPVLALVVLAVKLTSPGPVLFRQIRFGARGRPFTMYKFRSMVADAEMFRAALAGANEVTGPVFKIREDPRLTAIGAFLRRTSLDELPQLWNVLRGEMSLVGPRPAVPSEVARYEPWQRRRLSMKPGLTCLWQISGRSRVAFDRWMRLDLEYVDRWSLGLDLWILVRTIPAVLSGRGAS